MTPTLRRVSDELERDPRELALRTTAVLLLLYGVSAPRFQGLIVAVAGAMLVTRAVMNRFAWIACTALVIVIDARAWASIEQHKYMLIYWTLACTLSFWARDPLALLRDNARVLVGACFAFAAAWKWSGHGYLDGSFWEFLSLTRGELAFVAHGVGGVARADLESNVQAMQALSLAPSAGQVASLHSSPALVGFLRGVSWLALGIESLVAVAFLVPRRTWLSRHRDYFLIAFVVGTYVVLPFAIFAFILLAMGLVQTEQGSKRMRLAYVASFLWVCTISMGRLAK